MFAEKAKKGVPDCKVRTGSNRYFAVCIVNPTMGPRATSEFCETCQPWNWRLRGQLSTHLGPLSRHPEMTIHGPKTMGGTTKASPLATNRRDQRVGSLGNLRSRGSPWWRGHAGGVYLSTGTTIHERSMWDVPTLGLTAPGTASPISCTRGWYSTQKRAQTFRNKTNTK